MIKEIIEKWEERKHHLEEYFKTTKQKEYDDYEIIFRKIVEIILNKDEEDWDQFDLSNLVVINHGDYQGTLIFIIPKNTYQPSAVEYLVTNTYYGSCSGCDALQGIHNYDDGYPSEEQVSQYMTLALHLVQKMKWLEEPIRY